MSSVIDNRVVQMVFDNERFEKNVNESISTLDKLKAALKLDGATDSISNIEKRFAKFDFSSLGSAVDSIADKFTLLGMIGVNAMQKIASAVVDTGAKVVQSLSIDQISSGWDKYAQKTSAVQTIMAATRDTWDEYSAEIGYTGSQMDYVNDQMQKLNWFTDETSYNFVDMVSNIGKFTSNAVPLDQAVTSMQGIATWAAVSGQNATTASRAMGQLAQGISKGYFTVQDWMSLENANMATAQFKQKVLEVAEAQHKLQRNSEGTLVALDNSGKKTKEVAVDFANFRTTLNAKWFDKEVLVEVLDAYGSFTNELYEFSDATGLTATEIQDLLEQQEEGILSTEKLQKAADECGMSFEDFSEGLKNLGSEEYEFGRQAFKAAQEAKTFQEAVDSVKDAASTKWMNIFENIFGDYEKARKIWTSFAEFLYDVLVTPLEKIEEISKLFGEANGIERLGEAFMSVFNFLFGNGEEILGILGHLKKGFQEVFPELNAEEIAARIEKILTKIEEWAEQLELTEEASKKLEIAGRLVGQAFAFVINSAKNLWAATEPLRNAIKNIADAITDVIAGFVRLRTPLNDSTEEFQKVGLTGENVKRICEVLADIINNLTDKIRNNKKLVSQLSAAFNGFWNILKSVGGTIVNFLEDIQPLASSVANLASAIGNVITQILGLNSDLDPTGLKIDGFSTFVETLAGFINNLADAIREIDISGIISDFSSLEGISQRISGAFDTISSLASSIVAGITSAFQHLKDFFMNTDWSVIIAGGIIAALMGLVAYGSYVVYWLINVVKLVAGAIEEVIDVFWTMNKKNIADACMKLAAALLLLAAAMLMLSYVDYNKAIPGLVVIGAVLATLWVALESLSNIKVNIFKLTAMSTSLLIVSAALLVLAAALIVLAAALAAFALVAKMDTIAEGLLYLAATLAVAIVALAALSTIGPKVLIGAVALAILAASLVVLAAALAAFALVAKMDTIAEGLLYLAATLAVAVVGLAALSTIGPKVLIGAVALAVLAVSLIALAAALAAFALVAKLGDAAATGLLLMTATLAVVVVALTALGRVCEENLGGVLAASAALLVASAALLVLAAAFAAFALIAQMESAGDGMIMLVVSLGALTGALMLLGATGPVVIAGAAALLVGAAACLVLAVAVGVVSAVLPLLAYGLSSLGEAIGSALTSIGEGAENFLVSLSDALVAVGEALGEIITTIADSLGTAVSTLGSGIGEAITSIIASVGEGIGQGITAISDAIGTFGDNLTNVGTGIENFGKSVRSLDGISWTSTALGVGEFALALKKLNGVDTEVASAITNLLTSIQSSAAQMATIGQSFGDNFTQGIKDSFAQVTSVLSSMVSEGVSTITSGSLSWKSSGALLGMQLANGISSMSETVANAAAGLSKAAIDGLGIELEAGSFSDVTLEYGQFLGDGFAAGLLDKVDAVNVASDTMANTPSEKLQTGSDQMTTVGQSFGTNFAGGITQSNPDVTTASSDLVSAASEAISSSPPWDPLGASLGQGFANGIISMLGTVQAAAAQLASAASEALAAAAQIHSPSRVTTRFGEYFGQGFVNGIRDKIGSSEDIAEEMVNRTANTLNNARSLISNILEDDFTPVITPVLDTSAIRGSIAGMSGLNVTAGVNRVGAIGSISSPLTNQNGSSTPTTAVLSESAVRALAATKQVPGKTVIQFTGDLAQLARVLNPVIINDTNNHGTSLIRK